VRDGPYSESKRFFQKDWSKRVTPPPQKGNKKEKRKGEGEPSAKNGKGEAFAGRGRSFLLLIIQKLGEGETSGKTKKL